MQNWTTSSLVFEEGVGAYFIRGYISPFRDLGNRRVFHVLLLLLKDKSFNFDLNATKENANTSRIRAGAYKARWKRANAIDTKCSKRWKKGLHMLHNALSWMASKYEASLPARQDKSISFECSPEHLKHFKKFGLLKKPFNQKYWQSKLVYKYIIYKIILVKFRQVLIIKSINLEKITFLIPIDSFSISVTQNTFQSR